MDFERLEQAWRSEANRPTEDQQARLMEELMTTLKTYRRTEALLATIPVVTMTLFTLVAAAAVLRSGMALRDWLGLTAIGFFWLVLLGVLWIGFRARPSDDSRPLREILTRRMAHNRAERRNYHVFWAMTPVFYLPMWFAIQRLQDNGRLDTPAGTQALVICGIAVAASLGWNTLRFFFVTKPEQRRLKALLSEYE